MFKLASVALTSVLGVAGIAAAVPAEAHPYVSVAVGLPRIVVEPYAYAPAYYPPYAYGYVPGGYWHRGYDRERYEHCHRRWDRDDRHWDRR